MFRACLRIAAFVLAGSLLPGLEQAQPSNPKSVPLLEVARDTVLDPGTTYGRLVIKASNITIDGRGAWLIGARKRADEVFQGDGRLCQGRLESDPEKHQCPRLGHGIEDRGRQGLGR